MISTTTAQIKGEGEQYYIKSTIYPLDMYWRELLSDIAYRV